MLGGLLESSSRRVISRRQCFIFLLRRAATSSSRDQTCQRVTYKIFGHSPAPDHSILNCEPRHMRMDATLAASQRTKLGMCSCWRAPVRIQPARRKRGKGLRLQLVHPTSIRFNGKIGGSIMGAKILVAAACRYRNEQLMHICGTRV